MAFCTFFTGKETELGRLMKIVSGIMSGYFHVSATCSRPLSVFAHVNLGLAGYILSGKCFI